MQSIRIHAQAEVVWRQDRQRGERIDRGNPGWKRYFALIAEVTTSPEFGGVLMSRFFDPVVEKLIASIRRALPGCDDCDLYCAYRFLSGALTLTIAETGRIDKLSSDACRSSEPDNVHQRLVPYCAAGFRALCAPKRSVSRPTQPRRARK